MRVEHAGIFLVFVVHRHPRLPIGDDHPRDQPVAVGGVFGGKGSGVTDSTKNIFLESAWFHPVSIRKSSFKHQLRTDAAINVEKSVDIG